VVDQPREGALEGFGLLVEPLADGGVVAAQNRVELERDRRSEGLPCLVDDRLVADEPAADLCEIRRVVDTVTRVDDGTDSVFSDDRDRFIVDACRLEGGVLVGPYETVQVAPSSIAGVSACSSAGCSSSASSPLAAPSPSFAPSELTRPHLRTRVTGVLRGGRLAVKLFDRVVDQPVQIAPRSIVDAVLDLLVGFELFDLGLDRRELAPEAFYLLVRQVTRLHSTDRLALEGVD